MSGFFGKQMDPFANALGLDPVQNRYDEKRKKKRAKDAKAARIYAEKQGAAITAKEMRDRQLENRDSNIQAGRLNDEPLTTKRRLSV